MIKFESFSSDATSKTGLATTTRRLAQGFTPQQSHSIELVSLKVYRTTNSPTEIMTVEIRSDNSNKPSAVVLASGTSDPANWDAATWFWVDIVLDAQPDLLKDTKYWIVIYCAGVDSTHYIDWQRDSGGTYSGGCYASSTDDGVNWTLSETNDFMFEDWGTLTSSCSPLPHLPHLPRLLDLTWCTGM